jgi:1-phosphofructokinase
MIITVTLNPALDKTAHVDVLRPGFLNRLGNVTIDAGGKGINVSSMIAALGGKSIAVGFAGGSNGDELLSRLTQRGITHDFVRIKDSTRTNLKVISSGGVLTELNESGPEITGEEWRELEKKLLQFASKETIFVLSGSLPRNLGKDTYLKLVIFIGLNLVLTKRTFYRTLFI